MHWVLFLGSIILFAQAQQNDDTLLIVERPKQGEVLPDDTNLVISVKASDAAPPDSFITIYLDGTLFANTTEKKVNILVPLDDDYYDLEARLEDVNGQLLQQVTRSFQIGSMKELPDAEQRANVRIFMPKQDSTIYIRKPKETALTHLKTFIYVNSNGLNWKKGSTSLFATISRENDTSSTVMMGTMVLPTILPKPKRFSLWMQGELTAGSYIMQVDVIDKDSEDELISTTTKFEVVKQEKSPRKTPIAGISHVYVCHWSPLVDRRVAMEKTLVDLGLEEEHVTWITDYDRRNVSQNQIDQVYEFSESLHFERLKPFYPRLGQDRPPPLRKLSAPEVLVTMCHIKAYHLMMQYNDNAALIMEDDTCFVSDFKEKWEIVKSQTPANFDFLFIGSGVNQHVEHVTAGKLVYEYPHPSSRTAGSYVIKAAAAENLLQTMVPFALVSDGELDYQLWLHNMRVFWVEPNIAYEGTREGGHFESVVQEGRSQSQHAAVVTSQINSKGWYLMENVLSSTKLKNLEQAVKNKKANDNNNFVLSTDDSEIQSLVQEKLFMLGANASLNAFALSVSPYLCECVHVELHSQKWGATATTGSTPFFSSVQQAYPTMASFGTTSDKLFITAIVFLESHQHGLLVASEEGNPPNLVRVLPGDIVFMDSRFKFGVSPMEATSSSFLQLVMGISNQSSHICKQFCHQHPK